jgi:hypothetical protein
MADSFNTAPRTRLYRGRHERSEPVLDRRRRAVPVEAVDRVGSPRAVDAAGEPADQVRARREDHRAYGL